MNSDSVLVTGGGGFIGSHLVDTLLGVGYHVKVVDDFSTGSMANLQRAAAFGPKLEVVACDVAGEELPSLMKKISPRYVFHLAAQADVRHSMSDPIHDARVNVLGSLNVIESSRRVGVERFLYAASGGTLFGEPDVEEFPISELAQQRPLSNYGVSKMAVLDYLAAYDALYDFDYAALSLANVYGPRQDPHGESGVVSIFAGNLVAGRECVIFGDGEQTRDFIYVSDVVDAFISASKSKERGLFNVSSSIETSVNDLYSTMSGILGLEIKPQYLPGRVGELRRSCLSNTKARQSFGWTQRVDLEKGLSEVIEWVRAES